jgi:glycosyltransferase involved in cell wall biosynthesis
VTVVPLGVDPQQYDFVPDERRANDTVVSVIGTMDWYPTRSAAERLLTRLWPEIKRRVPSARAQIVGWNARSALAKFAGMPDVTIEENVPDIRPCFEQTSVLLYAPIRGSGMKIKILEAMGFGTPIVTTGEGVEGLPAEDGVHVGLCEDDAGLIERTVALLNNRQKQNEQRRAARALLESHCNPDATVAAIERIYERMLAVGTASGTDA